MAEGRKLYRPAVQHMISDQAIFPSLLLGLATGLLWAPCAGPILGLILTGAALQGANIGTSLLLPAYAAVAAIALGLDIGFLTQVSLAGTNALEQGLLDRFDTAAAPPAAPSMAGANPTMSGSNPAMMSGNAPAMMSTKPSGAETGLPVEGALPSVGGAAAWLNSPPLTAWELKGKVVLVDFWTYSCLRAIPYVRAWAEKYKDQGFAVIGVHAPEFAFEKRIDNVKQV